MPKPILELLCLSLQLYHLCVFHRPCRTNNAFYMLLRSFSPVCEVEMDMALQQRQTHRRPWSAMISAYHPGGMGTCISEIHLFQNNLFSRRPSYSNAFSSIFRDTHRFESACTWDIVFPPASAVIPERNEHAYPNIQLPRRQHRHREDSQACSRTLYNTRRLLRHSSGGGAMGNGKIADQSWFVQRFLPSRTLR